MHRPFAFAPDPQARLAPAATPSGWAARLSEALGPVQVAVAHPDGFGGHLRQAASADLLLVQASAVAHSVHAPPFLAPGGERPPFLLVAQSHEPWHVRQAGAMLHLRPGDVVLLDLAVASELHFPRGCACLYVRAPAAWVGRWLATERSAGPRAAWRDKGWGISLSALFRQLAEDLASADLYQGAALSDHLGAMLSAAVQPAPAAAQPDAPPELLARALAYMAAHIDRPGLGAATVAEALGVSVRTLHRGFAAAELPFAAMLRRLRMRRAAELLAQPQLRALPVARIGARCGYPEAAQFGRAFQREHGSSPASWRRQFAGGPMGRAA